MRYTDPFVILALLVLRSCVVLLCLCRHSYSSCDVVYQVPRNFTGPAFSVCCAKSMSLLVVFYLLIVAELVELE